MRKLDGRPQVVAHRGASADLAEHTLAAYVKALDDGAEGFECDVRLTADGHLVCVHDRNLRRVAGNAGLVSTMTLEQLNQFDFGSWKNPWAELDDEAPDVTADQRQVLTLRTLLEIARDYHRPIDLAIETKHPTRYAGLIERKVVQLLAEFGWAGTDSPARIMSFSPVALTRIQKHAPQLEVVLLTDNAYSWRLSSGVLAPGWIAGPGIDLLRANPRLGERLKRRRRRIHVWTVNTPEDLDLCLSLGVEAIITDRPRDTIKRLGELGP
ncbi:MAG: glycerophosphodiester phosphodiesterase [Nocardioidaceae bacterium]|nr:MAG: glycerophosphodiester phosphodiesterase [Nocardioidaceae bacterium]